MDLLKPYEPYYVNAHSINYLQDESNIYSNISLNIRSTSLLLNDISIEKYCKVSAIIFFPAEKHIRKKENYNEVLFKPFKLSKYLR